MVLSANVNLATKRWNLPQSNAVTSTNALKTRTTATSIKSVSILMVLMNAVVRLDSPVMVSHAMILTNVMMEQIVVQSILHVLIPLDHMNVIVMLVLMVKPVLMSMNVFLVLISVTKMAPVTIMTDLTHVTATRILKVMAS